MREFREYAGLIWAEWCRGVTGPLSAILFISGSVIGVLALLGVRLPAERITLPVSLTIAVLSFINSSCSVWLAEKRRRVATEALLDTLQAGNTRASAIRDGLRNLFREIGQIRERLIHDFNTASDAVKWINMAANWIGQNVNQAAREIFLDTSGIMNAKILGIQNAEQNYLILRLDRYRQNLLHIIQNENLWA